MMNNEWYEVVPVNASLTQGDIITNCPILNWSNQTPATFFKEAGVEGLSQMIRPFVADVIVMTQACDLEHKKVNQIVLAPHLSLQNFRRSWENYMNRGGNNPSEKAWRRMCDDIANGYVWNQTFLNQHHSEPKLDTRVVDFHQLYTLPIVFLESVAQQRGARLRLRSPYREAVSQAFARYFMRIGLPTPLDKSW